MTQVAPTPNEVIYSPRLPSVAELTNVAAAQGLSIEQINQTATQITVVHKNASGQLTTVAYQLLPTAAPQVATQQTVVVPAPAPTVIYQSAPRTVIYESYDPFPPSYYYPPVSLNFGFGYYRGWGGHHHHWHGR
ncbi:hypothetical protein DB354_05975 [Opitutus sp. ER46]|nr:hypothetical protein DB354_05975 [Opitutus sp. ER46]